MAKKITKKESTETDSVYFLKLVLYFLLGCMWLQINDVAIPVGFIVGLVFASHDHFQIDKKIEIAVLLIAAFLSFVAPIGFVLTIG